jgi:hypothetical protein
MCLTCLVIFHEFPVTSEPRRYHEMARQRRLRKMLNAVLNKSHKQFAYNIKNETSS